MMFKRGKKETDVMQETECILCGTKNWRLLFQAFDLKISYDWFNIVQCNDCGLVFTNPRPKENKICKYYSSSYYSYRPYALPKKINTNVELTKRILEIGCGSGEWLYKRKMEGNEVYGIEIDQGAIKIAKENGLNVFFGSLKEAKYQSEFFDWIHMSEVLEHLYDPLKTLKEVKRILKKGGKCTINVPNFSSLDAILLKGAWRELDVPRHLFHFTPITIEKVISRAGLKIIGKEFYYFPNKFEELEIYMRCLYSTFKLIYFNLIQRKQWILRPLFLLIALYKFIVYLVKKWYLRIFKKIKSEEKRSIYCTCVKK